MLRRTSVASVCLPLRTISIARLTAATSIAAAVTMVVAGGGIALGCASCAERGCCGRRLPPLETFLLRQRRLRRCSDRRRDRAPRRLLLRQGAPAASARQRCGRPAVWSRSSVWPWSWQRVWLRAWDRASPSLALRRSSSRSSVWAWPPSRVWQRWCWPVSAWRWLVRPARDARTQSPPRPRAARSCPDGFSRPTAASFREDESSISPTIAIALIGLRKAKIPRKRGYSWAHPAICPQGERDRGPFIGRTGRLFLAIIQ